MKEAHMTEITQPRCAVLSEADRVAKKYSEIFANYGHWQHCPFEGHGYSATKEHNGEYFCLFHSPDETDINPELNYTIKYGATEFFFIKTNILIIGEEANNNILFIGCEIGKLVINKLSGDEKINLHFDNSTIHSLDIENQKLETLEIKDSNINGYGKITNSEINTLLIIDSQIGIDERTINQQSTLEVSNCPEIDSIRIESSIFYFTLHLTNCPNISLLDIEKNYRKNKENCFYLVPYIEGSCCISHFALPKSLSFYQSLFKNIKKGHKHQEGKLSYAYQYKRTELLYKQLIEKKLKIEAAAVYYLKQKLYEKSDFGSPILRRLSWIYGFFGGYGVYPRYPLLWILALALVSTPIYINYSTSQNPHIASNIINSLIHSLQNTLPTAFFNNLPAHVNGIKSLLEKMQLSLGTLFWGFLLLTAQYHFRK